MARAVQWAYDRSRDPSLWHRSSCDSLRASIVPPGSEEGVLIARVEGEAELVGALAGDLICRLTVLEAGPRRDALVRERAGEARLDPDLVLLVFDATPGVERPGWRRATAFACVEGEGAPAVFVRGPEGWRRCTVLEYEKDGRWTGG